MSDRMSVTYARTYLDAWSTGDSVDMWKVRAARTVVAQAEQIERLQSVIRNIDIARGAGWIDALTRNGVILPGDMEPPA